MKFKKRLIHLVVVVVSLSISLVAVIPVTAAPPSIGSVGIIPDPAYTDVDLSAVPSDDWTDADGDAPDFVYEWQIWDEPTTSWLTIAAETGATLSNTFFGIGDRIKVICTPVDLVEQGSPVEDETIISRGIVTITPNPAFIDTPLLATPAHWLKPGDDPITFNYRWQIWDEATTSWLDIVGETGDSLNYTNFVEGDHINVVCTPVIDSAEGAPVQDDVFILGGIVSISPSPAYTDSTLVASPAHWVVPGADAITFSYQWQIWDESTATWIDIAGKITDTLESGNFSRGNELKIICTAVIDGEPGRFAEDTTTIVNSPPVIGGVIIQPNPGATGSSLTAIPTDTWEDADGDLPGFLYQWQIWDESTATWVDIDGETGAVMSNSNFTMNDRIRVTCTPYDGIDTGSSVDSEVEISIFSYDSGIDVKPGSEDNPINLKSNGVIPVAIYSSEGFDALEVDVATVKFGPSQASPVHFAYEDIDGDGNLDLILHFRTQDTGIVTEDTAITLTGETTAGMSFTGTDTIKIVPSESVQATQNSGNENSGIDYAPGQNKAPSESAAGKGTATAPGLLKEDGANAQGKAKGKE